jgi:DNA-binding MarR family transcriptional regulator
MVAVNEIKRSNGLSHSQHHGHSHSLQGSSGSELARSMLRIVPRMNRWAESRALDSERGGDLSLRQLSALAVIENETTTLGEVARRLMVTPAVVTGLIDRLERRGFVRRVGGGSDRRRVHLALTEEGRAASDDVEDHLIREIAQRLETLSNEEIDQLNRGLSTLARITADLESSTNH